MYSIGQRLSCDQQRTKEILTSPKYYTCWDKTKMTKQVATFFVAALRDWRLFVTCIRWSFFFFVWFEIEKQKTIHAIQSSLVTFASISIVIEKFRFKWASWLLFWFVVQLKCIFTVNNSNILHTIHHHYFPLTHHTYLYFISKYIQSVTCFYIYGIVLIWLRSIDSQKKKEHERKNSTNYDLVRTRKTKSFATCSFL